MSDVEGLPPIQPFEEFEREAAALMAPPPYVSKFGAVAWKNVLSEGVQHRWLVKGLLTEGELSMLAGGTQSGKTFIALDLAMAIALGRDWFGRRVLGGGVIYQAGEDPTGVRAKRLPAYVKANSLSFDDEVPFTLLTGGINLWLGDERTTDFIVECKHWASQMSEPLKLIVIDTYAKATTGADEISGKEMGVVLDRVERIRRETGAAVLLVDHLNADGGRVRGTANKTANIDAVLICRMGMVAGEKRGEESIALDHDNRKVREITNDQKFGGKIKNGEALMKPIRFVLRGVEIGRDNENDAITSCIVAPPAGEEIERREANAPKQINARLSLALKALISAISDKGRAAPAHIEAAPGGKTCVTLTDWRDAYAPMIAEENEDPDKLKERAKKQRDRAAEVLIDRNYIRKHGDWIWRTGRRVSGIDAPETSARQREPEALSPELQSMIDTDEIPF